ncbi:MAG: hypothetical protein ACXVIP_01845 [Halobacteriota archaeon]
MRFIGVALFVLLVIGMVLVSSGCMVKIENATQNATQEATKAPRNVPEYPNANRTYYSSARVLGQIATYQTNDSPKQVTEFYKTQMQEQGYTVSRDLQNTDGSGGLIIFTKGQDTVAIAIGENNGKTDIAIRTSFKG